MSDALSAFQFWVNGFSFGLLACLAIYWLVDRWDRRQQRKEADRG